MCGALPPGPTLSFTLLLFNFSSHYFQFLELTVCILPSRFSEVEDMFERDNV